MKNLIGSMVVLFACACSTSASTPPPSCESVCERVNNLCGDGAGCETECPSLTQTQRSCVIGASTCGAAVSCAEGSVADASTDTGNNQLNGACLDYIDRAESCGGACDTRVGLTTGVFCSRDCSESTPCGNGFYCVSGSCRPSCNAQNTDDQTACTTRGWSRCRSATDGLTVFYVCDNT